jgi:hypothetical protein
MTCPNYNQAQGFRGWQFILHSTIEGFVTAIFPATVGFDEQGVDAHSSQPTADRTHTICLFICNPISYNLI